MSGDVRAQLQQAAGRLAVRSTLLYVLGHVLDLMTTYLLSPELAREANPLVARYGLGWGFILASAAATSLLMLGVQWWAWQTLVGRFPGRTVAYRPFYRAILYGRAQGRGPRRGRTIRGALLGVLIITAYALITAKLLTGAWNLLLLGAGAPGIGIALVTLVKNGIAAAVGLLMFFLYPYRLYRRAASGPERLQGAPPP